MLNKDTRRSFLKNISAIGIASTGLKHFPNATKEQYLNQGEGENAVILFQGDSITDGNRSRNNDWNHVMGHGYAYLIASRLWFYKPEKHFHFLNRGVSGNKVTDLASRWQTDTLDLRPNVLSILIGVNDTDGVVDDHDTESGEKYETVYSALLQETTAQLPGIEIVICEPFILPIGRVKEKWDEWNIEIKKRQKSAKRLAAAFNAIYVPLQEEFDKALFRAPADYWIWDGIHPMPAGHELIARKWISTVRKRLHFI